MTAIKWWLRIVGTLYLMEGLGLTAAALFDPAEFAAIWASTEAGVLDAVAERGTVMAGLRGVLTWVLLGIMMWILLARTRAAPRAEIATRVQQPINTPACSRTPNSRSTSTVSWSAPEVTFAP
jgi:hypothetical protein